MTSDLRDALILYGCAVLGAAVGALGDAAPAEWTVARAVFESALAHLYGTQESAAKRAIVVAIIALACIKELLH